MVCDAGIKIFSLPIKLLKANCTNKSCIFFIYNIYLFIYICVCVCVWFVLQLIICHLSLTNDVVIL